MGTASFAVPSLEVLLRKGYSISAVVTAPDKPAGRGQKIRYSPVKVFATENNIPLLQPEKLKDETFVTSLQKLKPDLQIVVAFRMLPKIVWEIPTLGTFNLHASLLPQYRGAAPINHAIINGENETGVTTFFIDEKIDTGKIILRDKTDINDHESAGELHDRLMILGADLVLKTVKLIESGKPLLTDQESEEKILELKPAPKIFREQCLIDWKWEVRQINNFIRGLSPVPCAFSRVELRSGMIKNIKIFSCEIKEPGNPAENPGNISSDGKTYLEVSGKDGLILPGKIQVEGKKAMHISDFLRGFDPNDIVRFF